MALQFGNDGKELGADTHPIQANRFIREANRLRWDMRHHLIHSSTQGGRGMGKGQELLGPAQLAHIKSIPDKLSSGGEGLGHCCTPPWGMAARALSTTICSESQPMTGFHHSPSTSWAPSAISSPVIS